MTPTARYNAAVTAAQTAYERAVDAGTPRAEAARARTVAIAAATNDWRRACAALRYAENAVRARAARS